MKNILTTASVLTLLAATPALAAEHEVNTSAEAKTSGSVSTDVKKAWEDVKEDTSHAYENVKATFFDGTESTTSSSVMIDTRYTASGIIGKPVYNSKEERIGTVKDIIVNTKGDAGLVVIADGEFPGLDGKLVAFDYNVIAKKNADGDIIAPLSEDAINKVKSFSYDADESSNAEVRVIPAGAYSVAELVDGQLVNQKNETVAEVDNISFKNGAASQIIVSFDKVLGVGGEHAALNFNDTKIIKNGESNFDFQLSANQTAQFEAYKKTVTQ